jgi:hypothetical protein
MVRQHHPSIDMEWIPCARSTDGSAQRLDLGDE